MAISNAGVSVLGWVKGWRWVGKSTKEEWGSVERRGQTGRFAGKMCGEKEMESCRNMEEKV